jgi:hypothetical protein
LGGGLGDSKKALEICDGMTDSAEKARAVFDFIKRAVKPLPLGMGI